MSRNLLEGLIFCGNRMISNCCQKCNSYHEIVTLHNALMFRTNWCTSFVLGFKRFLENLNCNVLECRASIIHTLLQLSPVVCKEIAVMSYKNCFVIYVRAAQITHPALKCQYRHQLFIFISS